MITDSDIIRVLSDQRFERTVLAILRKRLSNHQEEAHVSESDRELPPEWGWIPIAQAATKYGLAPGDIDAAIAARHVLGNHTKVDEDSLRVFKYGKARTRGAGALETERPEDLEQPGTAPAKASGSAPVQEPSFSLAEAAGLLAITEERAAEHLLAGTLVGVGTDRVSKASVYKHRAHLLELGLVAPLDPDHSTTTRATNGKANGADALGHGTEPETEDSVFTTQEAAELLGVQPTTISVMVNRGVLYGVGRGRVARWSVRQYMETRAARRAPQQHKRQGPRPNSVPRYTPDPHYTGATITVAEAAKLLGKTIKSVSAMASPSNAYLQRVTHGVLTLASVQAYQQRQGLQPATT